MGAICQQRGRTLVLPPPVGWTDFDSGFSRSTPNDLNGGTAGTASVIEAPASGASSGDYELIVTRPNTSTTWLDPVIFRGDGGTTALDALNEGDLQRRYIKIGFTPGNTFSRYHLTGLTSKWLASVAAAAPVMPLTDDFNRPDSAALGSPFLTLFAPSAGTSHGPMSIIGNAAALTTTGTGSLVRDVGNSTQYAEMDVILGTDRMGLSMGHAVGVSDSTSIQVLVSRLDASNVKVEWQQHDAAGSPMSNNGVGATLANYAQSSNTFTMRVEREGTTYRIYFNGTLHATFTNPYGSGGPVCGAVLRGTNKIDRLTVGAL